MLTRQRPTLLTFEDEEEFNQAKKYLIIKGIDMHQAGTNQFGYILNTKKEKKELNINYYYFVIVH